MSDKNIKLAFSGDFGRALSVDAKAEDVKNKAINITLRRKAAQMLYADLEKALAGKQ